MWTDWKRRKRSFDATTHQPHSGRDLSEDQPQASRQPNDPDADAREYIDRRHGKRQRLEASNDRRERRELDDGNNYGLEGRGREDPERRSIHQRLGSNNVGLLSRDPSRDSERSSHPISGPSTSSEYIHRSLDDQPTNRHQHTHHFPDRSNRGNQSDFPQNRPQRPPVEFKYKRLERMSGDEDKNVLYELAGAETSLEITLNQSEIRRDLMTLLLRVLAKACHAGSTVAAQNTINVLSVVKTSTFLKEHLLQHISKMKNEESSSKKDTMEDNFRDCLSLFTSLVKHLPSTKDQVGVLLDLMTNACNTLSKQGDDIDQKIIDEIEELQKYQATYIINAPEEERQRLNRQGYSSAVQPPNDFRELSVFPTLEELTQTQQPFLRQNVVNGKYQDLQHYLDVQFRLMREDFVAPLRDGIAQFQAAGLSRNKKTKGIRVYKRVRVLYPVCTNTSIVYRVQFDSSLLRGIRWAVSKRLIHGSLICMSNDTFQTAIFGTVANRDPKQLKQGILDIDFKDDVRHLLTASFEFIMVESVAFFEAYRPVLEGLQGITEESLPFKSHILKVSPQMNQPQYLLDDPNTRFNLTALLKEDCAGADASSVALLDRQSWPPPGHMQLDQSQIQAVYAALTSDFSVIQGPPGTGKTHVGLKIIQVLLDNKSQWGPTRVDTLDDDDKTFGPILVVCYTNHALDQFLEGVLYFNKNIVRVGGRGKSEQLVTYNLNRVRGKISRGYNNFKDRSMKQARSSHKVKAVRIRCQVESKIEKFQTTFLGVVSASALESYMTSAQSSVFTPGVFGMLQWLELTNKFSRYIGYNTLASRHDREVTPPVDEFDEFDEFEEGELFDDDVNFQVEDSMTSEDDTWYPKAPENIGHLMAFDIKEFRRENRTGNDDIRKLTERICNQVQSLVHSTEKMPSIRANRLAQDIWDLSFDDRWNLYRFWVFCFRQEILQDILESLDEYRLVINALKEVMDQEDYGILRNADVIGMTTTRAAKSRSLLQRVKPKIIIIEEAAEILESHIVTTLNEHCKQLILIGDHQQLRPNPTVYCLAKDFNLDISLFERMVNNDFPCQRLSLQHRMRPDISHIIKKHFYDNLQDHESVSDRENVKGVSNNVFFIDHSYQERTDDDTRSHSNMHEASFMVAFCNYLLQQGYASTSITMLTTYTGQLLNFKRLMMDKQIFEGVHVCVVDSYQGEENDIILLSLVRSNGEGSIGFLKVSNRVCVALSRAKIGLFCIGNFEQLSRQSEHWKKITTTLKSRKQLGSKLTLACERHSEVKTAVSTEKDFKDVPEGGCKKPCEFRLDCDHVCDLPCHPYDPEHLKYRCTKQCSREICERNHRCKNKCYMPCPTVCEIKVEKELPRCGHKMKMACYSNPDVVDCQFKCGKTLACGHPCKDRCGKLCDKTTCNVMVKRDLPCSHSATLPCSAPLSACPVPCTALLECQHKCSGTCATCLQGRIHKPCTKRCGRILVCGHQCRENCTETCPPCKKPCENRCIHSKCKKVCGEPCVTCKEPCERACKHTKCSKLCGEPCDCQACKHPCLKKTFHNVGRTTGGSKSQARHPCIGICGEPCPNVCRICDPKVTEILFGSEEDDGATFVQLEDCKHVIETSGMDHWMNMADESQSTESVNIQMKTCPKCKTPIRYNMRYGNIIKKILGDINDVKARVRGNLQEIQNHETKAEEMLVKLMSCNEIDRNLKQKADKRLTKLPKSLHKAIALRNELSLLDLTLQLIRKINSSRTEGNNEIRTQIQLVRNRLFNDKLPMQGSDQEMNEFTLELERLDLWNQVCKVKHMIETLDDTKKTKIQACVDELAFLMDGTPLSEVNSQKAKQVLKQCREICTGLNISETERQSIVKAVGLSKGHWFKCPNGHIYVITECGGAMEEGTCPECKATIGGNRHALREDNTLAPEMDGAKHAAWSDQANMDNYDLGDIH